MNAAQEMSAPQARLSCCCKSRLHSTFPVVNDLTLPQSLFIQTCRNVLLLLNAPVKSTARISFFLYFLSAAFFFILHPKNLIWRRENWKLYASGKIYDKALLNSLSWYWRLWWSSRSNLLRWASRHITISKPS